MKYELPSIELIVIEENNYLKFGEYLNDMQCDDTVNKLNIDDLEYVKKLQQENKELKKQLEEINKMIEKCGFVNIEQVMLNYCGLLTQQKEFIKYLEDEKDRLARVCNNICEDKFDEINDILQKYKAIIGVSDEKES